MTSFKTFLVQTCEIRCPESLFPTVAEQASKKPAPVETETVFVHLFGSF